MTGRPFRTTRDIVNLRQGRNEWYRIENLAPGARIDIFDEIGFFGVNAADFTRDMTGISGDLDVHLNCPGGDVFEGIAIYNALARHNGTVTVHVDGLAASAASFIAQAASPGNLVIAKSASMMIHDAFAMGIGNSADLRDLASLLDQQSDAIAGIYADRSGRPAGQWREAMRAETWYVGQDAVDAGLADRVEGQAAVAAGTWDLSVFAAAVDNSPWDGDKAMANGAASDDPAAFYKGICAGRKSGDPSKQESWALPYKYHPSDPPNAAGVRNALSRLPQTHGLTNESEARSLLERLMKQIGPGNQAGPTEPPAPVPDYAELIRSAFAQEGSA